MGNCHKFQAEKVNVLIRSVTAGRTGAVTPVANLDPVQLSGAAVKRIVSQCRHHCRT